MNKLERDRFIKKTSGTLKELFKTALKNGKLFEFSCCLIRVGGMEDAGWDDFEESQKTVDLMQNLCPGRLTDSDKKQVQDRINLFTYCHLIEAKAPYHIIANLLRLANGNHYSISPFFSKKKVPKTLVIPPKPTYPKEKLAIIKVLDTNNLIYPVLKEIYSDVIRNAFYHSDFVIEKNEFRIPSGVGTIISIKEVRNTLERGIIFYQLLFQIYYSYKFSFKKFKDRVHDFDKRYGEKIEFLVKNKGELFGFEVSRPNGTNSRFTRTEKGVGGINMTWGDDGEVGFFMGDLDKLKTSLQRPTGA